MLPTYKNEQRIIVEKNYYRCNHSRPSLNDIVVFKFLKKDFIKRVVGVAGDRLTIQKSILYINSKTTNVKLSKRQEKLLGLYQVIPKGSILVLGDNLVDSKDSRDFGPIPISSISGRVLN